MGLSTLLQLVLCGITTAIDLVGTNGCTASACVFANSWLRFGTGSQTSINAQGLFVQPFYFSQISNTWFKLTYSNYPLDTAIGTGTGGPNWSGTTVVDLYAVTPSGSVNDYSGFTVTSSDASISTGYGRIVTNRTFTINGQNIIMQNIFSLGINDRFVKINNRIYNNGLTSINNLHIWVGTRDDYVGNTDSNMKTRGNIANGQFVPLTAVGQQSYAIMITNPTEGILFYSETTGVNTIFDRCCAFSNSFNLNPATASIATASSTDGSYAAVLPLGNIPVDSSADITWYYAAGAISSLSNVVQNVAVAQQEAASPTGTSLATPSETSSFTSTASETASYSSSETNTQTSSESASQTSSNTASKSRTQTSSSSASKTSTQTASSSASKTGTQTPSSSASQTASKSGTQTASNTASKTGTQTSSSSASKTGTQTASSSASQSASNTASKTGTQTSSSSASKTGTQTASSSASQTASNTASKTGTQTASSSASKSGTQTASSSASQTASQTGTQTPSSSASQTASQTNTQTSSNSASQTITQTASKSGTQTSSQTASNTASETASLSAQVTSTPLYYITNYASTSQSPVQTPSISPTYMITRYPSVALTSTHTSSPLFMKIIYPSISTSPNPQPIVVEDKTNYTTQIVLGGLAVTALGIVIGSQILPRCQNPNTTSSKNNDDDDNEKIKKLLKELVDESHDKQRVHHCESCSRLEIQEIDYTEKINRLIEIINNKKRTNNVV